MKILVTGANGYLGLNLVKGLIRERREVVALTKTPIPFEHEKLQVVLGDVMDVQQLLKNIKVEVIFHVAARINFTDSDEAIAQLTRDNITATDHLGNFACSNGIRKFINSSSCSVYEENFDPAYWITEEHTLRPRNSYAVSKLTAEWILAEKLSKSSVELVSLRYSSIYGHHQKPGTIFPILIHNAHFLEDLNLFGSGNRTQDYVYIDDVVNANLLCLAKQLPFNTRLNIGSGEIVTDLRLAHEIKEIWKSDSKINILNRLTKAEDYFNYNIEKAKLLLGYQPLSLAEGLKLYKENYAKG